MVPVPPCDFPSEECVVGYWMLLGTWSESSTEATTCDNRHGPTISIRKRATAPYQLYTEKKLSLVCLQLLLLPTPIIVRRVGIISPNAPASKVRRPLRRRWRSFPRRRRPLFPWCSGRPRGATSTSDPKILMNMLSPCLQSILLFFLVDIHT